MNTREDRFSKKILETPPSGIRKFFDLIIGRDDIISLGVGEPDFPTPWSIREEAYYHLEQGHTSYTSNWGLLELREAIAEYLTKYGLDYNPKNEILVTIGVSEAVDAVLRSILGMKSLSVSLATFHINLWQLCVTQNLFTSTQV